MKYFFTGLILIIIFFTANNLLTTKIESNPILTENNILPLEATKKLSTQLEINKKQILLTPKKMALTSENKNNCLTIMDENKLLRHPKVKIWLTEIMLLSQGEISESIRQYTYFDKDELDQLIDNNDSIAMWVKGYNELWGAQYTGKQTRSFQPSDLPHVQSVKRKILDIKKFKKAQHLFMQSALHGNIAGLEQLKGMFIIETFYGIKNNVDAKKAMDKWHVNVVAHYRFMSWVAPNHLKTFGSGFNKDGKLYSPQVMNESILLFNQLREKWIAERAKLGYSEKIDLFIPEDVRQILKPLHLKPCE